MRYSKAPISEVIMGISYKNAKIPVDFILKNALLSEEFPIVEIVQPLCLETLSGFQVQANFDQNSGPFLVRRWASNRKWLLQIQANMLYLNWIRLDTEPVGTYVGFSSIRDKFLSILADLEKITKVNLRNDVVLCDLTYNDRVKWQPEISDLSEIGKIIHINTPPKFSEQGYNNVFSRYTFHDFELNGFGLINTNTVTAIDGEQLIKLESSLRGRCVIDGDIETWFEQAHTKHIEIFEQIFTKEIKAKWQ
jgi:uncharacterized protein (TIGR04255 family)